MIGKFRDDRQVAAHAFDKAAQDRDQDIAALFQPGDLVLRHAKGLGRMCLRLLVCLAPILQRQLLRDQLGRAAGAFLVWCEDRGLSKVDKIQPIHAAYIEQSAANAPRRL